MAKKIKSKYTVRKDGRICRTETIGGERKYFYGKTDEEVDAKYDAYIGKLEAPITMSGLIDEWWEKKEKEISDNTYSGFNTAKNRIKSAFGDWRVSDVGIADIYSFLDEFRAKNYSSKVIMNTRCVFKLIMDYAIIKRIIKLNPVSMCPTVKGNEKEYREPATDNDVKVIEAHKDESLNAIYYYFVLWTGLRRSEALCLQHRDIDRKAMTVTVSKNIAWKNSVPSIKLPKTKAGIRTVYIPQVVLDILPDGKPDDLVFFPGEGLPHKSKAERFVTKFPKKYNLDCRPHNLRHKFASILHTAEIDVKDAAVALGHKNVAVTNDIYTHLEQKQVQKFREKIDAEMLSRSVVKSGGND